MGILVSLMLLWSSNSFAAQVYQNRCEVYANSKHIHTLIGHEYSLREDGMGIGTITTEKLPAPYDHIKVTVSAEGKGSGPNGMGNFLAANLAMNNLVLPGAGPWLIMDLPSLERPYAIVLEGRYEELSLYCTINAIR